MGMSRRREVGLGRSGFLAAAAAAGLLCWGILSEVRARSNPPRRLRCRRLRRRHRRRLGRCYPPPLAPIGGVLAGRRGRLGGLARLAAQKRPSATGAALDPGASGPGVGKAADEDFLGGALDVRTGWPFVFLDHFQPRRGPCEQRLGRPNPRLPPRDGIGPLASHQGRCNSMAEGT